MKALRDPRPREKDVQRAVVRLLTLVGFRVRSTSQYRASHVAPGIPDLMAHHRTLDGLFLWFEVKRPRAKGFQLHDRGTWVPEPLSADQEAFRQDALFARQHHFWGGVPELEEALIQLGLGERLASGVFQARPLGAFQARQPAAEGAA